MKAKLLKASDWDYAKKVEVETIADCLEIYDRVIIEEIANFEKTNGFEDCEITITIYDDYVE